MPVQKVTSGKLTFWFGVEQGTQEWLELRKGRVTCSNAMTLMTRGKNFCLQANEDDADRITPNGNGYAERGHVIEAETRDNLNAFLQPYGLKLVTCTFITNSDYPDAGYSPDGLIVPLNTTDWTKEENFIPAEFKAYNDVVVKQAKGGEKVLVHRDKHHNAVNDFEEVPLAARAQCQMEMLITGADKLCLVLANPDAEDEKERVKIWWVDKDQKYWDRLIQKLSS